MDGKPSIAILNLRENDGSEHAEPEIGVDFLMDPEPEKWRQDPISENAAALGARWAEVKPFVMKAAS